MELFKSNIGSFLALLLAIILTSGVMMIKGCDSPVQHTEDIDVEGIDVEGIDVEDVGSDAEDVCNEDAGGDVDEALKEGLRSACRAITIEDRT